ncbi:hypothetical protein CERSUDRAFT_125802 [Gelatoporia subvermispora B]|uniref:Uncharacterized protein n=1 Tax=Ceriporiopsis subvermispora (strain B) TaxID=914234 RepID=M2QAV5_CERS8|nr:hypothetical protein CERSUDRAFT_125802 [Gelatoporia subvermispora B]
MAGANYMGGKRNAVRARAKDAVGKIQKNHFGKQRLDILSKGLRKVHAQTPLAGRASIGKSPPEISLAHARHLPRASPSQIQQQGKHVSAIPHHMGRLDRLSPPNSGASKASRKSKILSVLDTTELRVAEKPHMKALCLRIEMTRIAKIPDLLGLPRKPEPKVSTAVASYHRESLPEENNITDRHVSLRSKRRKFSLDSGVESTIGERESHTPLVAEEGTPQCSRQYDYGVHPDTISHPSYPRFSDFAYTEDNFKPMTFDSSPAFCGQSHEDSGFAEPASILPASEEHQMPEDYRPTRYAFYKNDASSSPLARSRPGTAVRTILRRQGAAKPGFLGAHVAFSSPSSLSTRSHGRMSPIRKNLLSGPRIPALSLSALAPEVDELEDDDNLSQPYVLDTSCYGADVDKTDIPAGVSTSNMLISAADVSRTVAESVPSTSESVDLDFGLARAATAHNFPYSGADDASSEYDRRTSPSLTEPDDPVQRPDEASHVQQTLYDLLDGKIFEDADPWKAINEILDLTQCATSDSDSSARYPTAATPDTDSHDVLTLIMPGRRGVGHTAQCTEPTSEHRSMQCPPSAKYCWAETIPILATSAILSDAATATDSPRGRCADSSAAQRYSGDSCTPETSVSNSAAGMMRRQIEDDDLANVTTMRESQVVPACPADVPAHPPGLDDPVRLSNESPLDKTFDMQNKTEAMDTAEDDRTLQSSKPPIPTSAPAVSAQPQCGRLEDAPAADPDIRTIRTTPRHKSPRIQGLFEGPCLFVNEKDEEEGEDW